MSFKPVAIRRGRCSDLATLLEVRNCSAYYGCGAAYSSVQLSAWLARPLPEKMLDLLSRGCVYVAESSGEIVGYSALDPDANEIEAVFVLPSFSGLGVGGMLLHSAEKLAIKQGLSSLSLSASLNAVPFYRSAGYVSTSQGRQSLNKEIFLEYECMEKVLCDAS
ncbi:GNAT family N-acetyltransferase [Halomonas sp. ML-15]|uniref:GNAT family N-acetyltransferase n=1 Tax=Halomonas sp. ML-15 TaxID=2773305 RepID=UPI0017463498|nr:GNAT family N-acetyltransferase [Halomonas sp. ML-15]MBD3895012.1 GNAT family N-acetyltransferase [Halomonas sp. ML-15]